MKFEEEKDNVVYYEDDHNPPLFSSVSSGYPASELANMLMSKNINLQRVSHIQPLGVTNTATFVVDLDDVAYSDLTADDPGTWSSSQLISRCLPMELYVLPLESPAWAGSHSISF